MASRFAAVAAVCMLTVAQIATAQGTDCLISPPGATFTCPNPTLPATQLFTVGVPAITNPTSSFTAQWTLLNNTAGASIIGASSCGSLPGGATCPLAVQVTQSGTVTVRADLVITTVTGSIVNKNCEVTVTVIDTTPPTITCPSDVNVECNTSTAPSVTGTATAVDACSSVTVTFSDTISGSTCAGPIISRTWTATDTSGNTASCVQIITTVDTMPPSITCPAPVSVSCFALVPPADIGSVVTSDNCGGTVTVMFIGDAAANGQSNCNNVITRTYRATDVCGNFADCTQTITVNDTTPPSITCPGAVSVQCFSQIPPANVGAVVTSDNCGGIVTVTHLSDAPSNGQSNCNNVVVRTYRATDSCGNFADCTQTITVNDTTVPTITCPAPVSVECFSQVPAVDTSSVLTSDNCGGTVTVTHLGDVATNGQSNCNLITRTYRATDSCGNFADCTQTITVNDITPPTITCPPDVTVPCGSSTDPTVTGSATATDNCDPNPTIGHSDVQAGTCSTTPDPNPTSATITRTWTATDSCNNTSSCVQIITLQGSPLCTPPKVLNLGGGCGPQAPQLTMSLPMLGGDLSLNVGSAASNAQLVLVAQFAPFGPATPLVSPCVVQVDIGSPTTLLLDQFSTDSNGQWTQSFPLAQRPELANVTFRVQAAVISPGGPLTTVQLSDAIQGTFGDCPPCTASREDWVGVGPTGITYAANWLTLFPGGMDIGIFNSGNGNVAPNGFRWTGDLTGQNALTQFLANLPPPGSTNSIILQDLMNPTTTIVASPGSGSLARYTAVLQLNIVFSAAGLLGGNPVPQPGIGPLVYMNPGDSLDGFTVNQILALANQVLAGVSPVPAGYTLTTLAGLLEELSLSFENCTPSAWATAHLFVVV